MPSWLDDFIEYHFNSIFHILPELYYYTSVDKNMQLMWNKSKKAQWTIGVHYVVVICGVVFGSAEGKSNTSR